MRSVERYQPQFRTEGLKIIVSGDTKSTWTKQVPEKIMVPTYGYATPTGRQEDDTRYSGSSILIVFDRNMDHDK